MGLLDQFNTEDGLLAGLAIMAAGAAKPRRTSIGEGLLQGLQVMRESQNAREDRDMRRQSFGVQQQQLQIALDQAKRQAAEQQRLDAWRDSIPAPQGTIPLPVGPYLGAARDSQAANVPQPMGVDPQHQMLFGAMRAGAINPLQYHQALQKDNTPIKLGAGERMYDRTTGKVLFDNPKEDAVPSAVREYQFAQQQGYPGTFAEWEHSRRRAGASQVNVDRAPQGYMWQGPGKLAPIPGGPADKLPERQQNQVVGVQNLRDAISEYRAQLGTHSKLDALSPGARAEMGTKYQNMMLQAKEAYNLGVLNGPDLAVLQSVITDPMSINGLVTPRRSLDRQAAELDRIMVKIADAASQVRPRGASPGAPAAAAPAAAPASAPRVVNFGDLK